MERFRSIHRVGIAAVAIVLALAGPAQAGAQPRQPPKPELQKLWREFPLDSSRGSPSSRGRSIERPGKIAPVAQKASTQPRADVTVREERASPVGTTPAESEDKPPKWIQLVFIVTVLVPIAILALGLRDIFVRRSRRASAESRQYPLAVTADAARDTGRSGSERLTQDPRRGAFLEIRASAGRHAGSPRNVKAAQQSEVSRLKAKAPDRAKQIAALASETDVIKSKSSSEPEAEFLKKKSGSHSGLPHEPDSAAETGLLKEKLAAEKAIGSAHPEAQLRGSTWKDRPGSKLRALPGLKTSKESAAEPGRDLFQGAPLRCEIRWPLSEGRSQFVAVITNPPGASSELASSPEFRWRKSEPPPETSDTAEALRILVSGLVRDGWTVEGRGDDWYAIRLAAAARQRPHGSSVRKRNRSSERRPS